MIIVEALAFTVKSLSKIICPFSIFKLESCAKPDENQTVITIPAVYDVMYHDEFDTHDAVMIYQKKKIKNKKETIR